MDTVAAQVMITDFPAVDANTTVADAEVCLETARVSGLPVLNPDRTVFGMLTPQNLAHFYRQPLNNPRAFHAWEICNARPLIVNQCRSLDEVSDALLESHCALVLVVDDARRLVGVILAESLLDHWLTSTRGAADQSTVMRRQ